MGVKLWGNAENTIPLVSQRLGCCSCLEGPGTLPTLLPKCSSSTSTSTALQHSTILEPFSRSVFQETNSQLSLFLEPISPMCFHEISSKFSLSCTLNLFSAAAGAAQRL
jgi:hypothetical protein